MKLLGLFTMYFSTPQDGKKVEKLLLMSWISNNSVQNAFSTLFPCRRFNIAVSLQRQNEKNMKRKTIGIIVAALMLVLVGGIRWNLRDLPQKRLLNGAESIAFTDVDGTERLLAQVDTTRLTESSQMLYNLLRALVNEERWYLNHADTASSLVSR